MHYKNQVKFGTKMQMTMIMVTQVRDQLHSVLDQQIIKLLLNLLLPILIVMIHLQLPIHEQLNFQMVLIKTVSMILQHWVQLEHHKQPMKMYKKQ